MSDIQRYNEDSPVWDHIEGRYQYGPVKSSHGKYVLFSDYEADVQKQVAAAVQEESERCISIIKKSMSETERGARAICKACRKKHQQALDSAVKAERERCRREEVKPLRAALQDFVDYYDQAGIGDVSNESLDDDEDEHESFDGDECYNQRKGEQALAAVERIQREVK